MTQPLLCLADMEWSNQMFNLLCLGAWSSSDLTRGSESGVVDISF
jgi:hypothetical protein